MTQRNLKVDLFALVLLALVIFLGVALATYDPTDPPSTLVFPIKASIANACGRWGAWAAELLLRGVGIGAWLVVVSLAVLDLVMLARKPIADPLLRGVGWLMTLCGVSTFAAMALPQMFRGPVIGPGGYLGAAGRGLLEMNFASAGAYILVLCVIVSGLLLCTDYFVVHSTALLVGLPTLAAVKLGNKLLGRKRTTADDLAIGPKTPDNPSGAVSVKSRKNRAEEPVVAKTAPLPAAMPLLKSKPVPAAVEEEADEDEAEEEETVVAPAKPGLGSRLAAAVRIKNLNKSDQRQEVIAELDAASQTREHRDYELPPIDLLLTNDATHPEEHEKEVRQKAKMLEKTFEDFGFTVKVVEIETGPVIAQYEIELEAGLRLSKITGLADDLAIALRVPSVRIVAPIPGKNTVGIEVPNANRQLVRLREVIEETLPQSKKMRIPIFLGKDVSGNPLIVDLATLPHLLIAGRTGTGKSVCLNSIILSMLMTRRPDEVRMLMIDPKMVELSPYKKLPHLMHPVVTDMRKAEAILAWAVEKMEERYSLLARAGVRHISVYNQLGEEELMDRLQPEDDEQRAQIPLNLPYIVIVADEIADMMMTAGKEVEQHIIRLAQKSRAVGIHLVLATQKPTVDVITGLIKSNLPARIAFQVASRVDSRVVLDEMGADKLLGNGDMLFLWPGTSTMIRGQGTYLSDDEINKVVDHVGTDEQQFVKELVQLKANAESGGPAADLKSRDELYEAAVDLVVREGRGSVSLLQRGLGIGYGRAARLVDYMAEDGIVGQYAGSQAREVLITLEQVAEMFGGDASAEPPTKARRNKISPDKAERGAAAGKTAKRPKVIKPLAGDELEHELTGDGEDELPPPPPTPRRLTAISMTPAVDEEDEVEQVGGTTSGEIAKSGSAADAGDDDFVEQTAAEYEDDADDGIEEEFDDASDDEESADDGEYEDGEYEDGEYEEEDQHAAK